MIKSHAFTRLFILFAIFLISALMVFSASEYAESDQSMGDNAKYDYNEDFDEIGKHHNLNSMSLYLMILTFSAIVLSLSIFRKKQITSDHLTPIDKIKKMDKKISSDRKVWQYLVYFYTFLFIIAGVFGYMHINDLEDRLYDAYYSKYFVTVACINGNYNFFCAPWGEGKSPMKLEVSQKWICDGSGNEECATAVIDHHYPKKCELVSTVNSLFTFDCGFGGFIDEKKMMTRNDLHSESFTIVSHDEDWNFLEFNTVHDNENRSIGSSSIQFSNRACDPSQGSLYKPKTVLINDVIVTQSLDEYSDRLIDIYSFCTENNGLVIIKEEKGSRESIEYFTELVGRKQEPQS